MSLFSPFRLLCVGKVPNNNINSPYSRIYYTHWRWHDIYVSIEIWWDELNTSISIIVIQRLNNQSKWSQYADNNLNTQVKKAYRFVRVFQIVSRAFFLKSRANNMCKYTRIQNYNRCVVLIIVFFSVWNCNVILQTDVIQYKYNFKPFIYVFLPMGISHWGIFEY